MRALRGPFGICVSVGLLGWRVRAATTTNATCVTASWTFNQENQSPCFVASALLGACNGGSWVVYPVTTTQVYEGAVAGGSNGCLCSTVPYSLISACATCQGAEVSTWATWSTNCGTSDIHVSSFPLTIPSSVTVPAWAYLDVTVGGTWDSNAAMNDHNPDSSAVAPTSTSNAATSAAGSLFPTGTSTITSKGSSHVGPIVGGVVGGIGAIALLGLLGFLLYRRKQRMQRPAPILGPTTAENQTLMGFKGGSPELVPPYPGSRTSGMVVTAPPQSVKLYNPDDPSTYPGMQQPSQPPPPPPPPSGYTNPGGYSPVTPTPPAPFAPPIPEL